MKTQQHTKGNAKKSNRFESKMRKGKNESYKGARFTPAMEEPQE